MMHRSFSSLIRSLLLVCLSAALAIGALLFLFSEEVRTTQAQVRSLMEVLKEVQTPEDEVRILENLWELSFGEPYVNLTVSVTDAEGNRGINLLQTGVEPFEVTVGLQGEGWSEWVTFTPLEVSNVYVLLNE